MDERYDIAIIGSGPAGISAALNAKIRNKRVIVFGQRNLSNKLVKAPLINNYLGFYNITGEELKNRFKNHIKNMNINLKYERVNNVYSMEEYFILATNDNTYEASSVILATGIEFSKPLLGEREFLGKGVGYCATCDAPLYKNKTVAIISHNKDGEDEANYVNELARKLYYIPKYKDNYNLHSDIKVVNKIPKKIIGEEIVEKLILEDDEIVTDAIFILKDVVSPEELVPGLYIENGYILVDKNMETNIKGLFAAGDCTGKPYQYMKAAGQGQIAALSAVYYMDNIKKNI